MRQDCKSHFKIRYYMQNIEKPSHLRLYSCQTTALVTLNITIWMYPAENLKLSGNFSPIIKWSMRIGCCSRLDCSLSACHILAMTEFQDTFSGMLPLVCIQFWSQIILDDYHRMVWVGKNFKCHLIPITLPGEGHFKQFIPKLRYRTLTRAIIFNLLFC